MNDENLPIETKKFMNDITEAIRKHFPRSTISAVLVDCFGLYISVRVALYANRDECVNRILENDPWRNRFEIKLNADGSLMNPSTAAMTFGGKVKRISTKKGDEQYLVYGAVKTPFRKKTASPDKIVHSFEKWAVESGKAMLENADAINAGCIKGLYDVRTKVVI